MSMVILRKSVETEGQPNVEKLFEMSPSFRVNPCFNSS